MISHAGTITIWVRDQDEALKFYTEKMGLEVYMDDSSQGFRWLTVRPKGAQTAFVLMEPSEIMGGPAQKEFAESSIGRGPGIVWETDDIQATHRELSAKGIEFIEPPAKQPWGMMQAIFRDLYGNAFVLVEPPRGM